MRSNTRLLLEVNPFSNPSVLLSVSVTTSLQLILVSVEPLRNFFNTHDRSGLALLICLGFSALVLVWIEAEKLFSCWYASRK